jgi:hypothetical protein
MRIAGTLDLPSDWGLLKRRMLISRDSMKDGDIGDVGKVRDDQRSYRHVFFELCIIFHFRSRCGFPRNLFFFFNDGFDPSQVRWPAAKCYISPTRVAHSSKRSAQPWLASCISWLAGDGRPLQNECRSANRLSAVTWNRQIRKLSPSSTTFPAHLGPFRIKYCVTIRFWKHRSNLPLQAKAS